MILVDESDPIDEVEPTFPYREVNTRRGLKIREAYEILDEIGRGKFGRVFRCKDPENGLVLAAKVVSTKRKEERRNVEREIEIMKKLQHPRLIQLYDALEDLANSEMCLVLEMVGGGELFDRVIQDEFVLTERACAVFVRQISEAVEYIHSQNILHLDMKPENVMCLSKKGNRIKIIDFGLARFYDPNKKLQVLFGTPEFVAPEVVNFEAIDYATDMWSVGVITYVLLSGLSPFMGETDVETMANVTIAKYDFDDECFDDISVDAKDFISKLLVKDKKTRLTASECLKHRWLLPRNPDTCPSTPQLPDKPIIYTAAVSSASVSNDDDDHDDDHEVEEEEEVKEEIVTEISQRTSSPSSELIITDLVPSSCCSSPVQIIDNKDDQKIEMIENNDQVDSHLIDELPSASTPSPVCNSSAITTGDQSESESGYSGSGHSDDEARQNSSRPVGKIPGERKLQNKLDLTKDNLRDFVARWTDTPYLFDSPKGIITHLCTETERNLADPERSSSSSGGSNLQHQHYRIPAHSHSQSNLPHENSFECGINIVNQIRRFSYQLHEELQMMKNQCNKSLRKCSWSEVSVNAQ